MRHPFSFELADLELCESLEQPAQGRPTPDDSSSHSSSGSGGAAAVSGGLSIATTKMLGEEGGHFPGFPIRPPFPICRPTHPPFPRPLPKPIPHPLPIEQPEHPIKPPFEVTTLAIGEEGGGWDTVSIH
ncbi:MAG: hypothetical protein HC771_02625 [Synechococcales cyanobacterium CRU_2_2]|nr:hypothetical protein [Synechococcales cyanobacterium CRU_2_2]